ncbi:MAG: Ppx/GppA family phosphatase [Actinobacteria bacterium]|nr:Ppx/GppA family phosphatase [Actinomycetota bacterium]
MVSNSSLRVAALDIGTNSTRLLIAEKIDVHGVKSINEIVRLTKITRLGQGVDKDKNISTSALHRVSEALFEYRDLMSRMGVDRYLAVGTSALRDANNSSWFTEQIRSLTGIDVAIISGDREASLSFRGATYDLGRDAKRANMASIGSNSVLVFDVGGGSTEYMLGKDHSILLFKSIDVGCVRMSERFLKSDSPTKHELAEMLRFIEMMISDTIKSIKDIGVDIIIGTAGTATNLSAMNLDLIKYDPKVVHMSKLSLDFIQEQFKMLSGMAIDERKRVIGLEPARADIIVGGIAVTMRTLEMLNKNEMIVSEKDMLDGIVLELLEFLT